MDSKRGRAEMATAETAIAQQLLQEDRVDRKRGRAEMAIAQQQTRGLSGSNSAYSHHEQVAKPTYNLTENTDGQDAFGEQLLCPHTLQTPSLDAGRRGLLECAVELKMATACQQQS